MRSEHLKEHRLTHTEGRYFSCFMCDARFSAKSSLYVHIKKHQGKTTMEETTNVIDEVLERDTFVTGATGGQKRTRTKESHCSRVRPISVKPSNRRSTESIHTVDAECFQLDDAALCNDIEPSVYDPMRFQTDHLRTLYYCPVETCAYLYGNEKSLRQHAIKAHGGMIARYDDDDDDDADSLEKDSDAIMDYILYTVPSSSSNSSNPVADEQMIMVMADDAQVVDLSTASSSSLPTTTDRCLPESEPPPPSLNNAVLPKNTQSSRTGEETPAMTKSKDQGSARTDLTLADVLRLKMNGALAVTNCSVPSSSDSPSSDMVTLGANDLCESLLLTEELPSMYYQDDVAGAEYQVLLLDSGPLGSAGNLRGLE